MMDCKHLTDDVLLDNAEHKLPRDVRKQVDYHLKKCDACRNRADDVVRIAAAIRKQPSGAPPQLMAQLDDAVMAFVRNPKSTRPASGWLGFVYAAAGVAAAALVVTLVSVWAMRHKADEPTIVREPTPPKVEPKKPEIVNAPKPEPEKKPEPKPEPKPDPKIVNENPRPEPPREPDPKPEPKPEPKIVDKPQPKPEPKPEPKPDPKPEPAPVAVKLEGDLNGDGKVDIADRLILTSYLNDGGDLDATADLNGDGKIDVADAQIIAQIIADQP
jgi:hypothetical protein